MWFATDQCCCAFCQRVINMRCYLVKSLLINQRALLDTGVKTVADFHRSRFFGKTFGKFIIDAVLHKNPVCTNTSLSGIAVFRQHRAFNSDIKIGIIKHQQWRIAAKLKAHLLDRIGTLAHQNAANFG